MDVKLELLKGYIADYIDSHMQNFDIDVDKITDTVAISILAKVKGIIGDENNSDFEVVEEIVRTLEANGIDCGGRHDF